MFMKKAPVSVIQIKLPAALFLLCGLLALAAPFAEAADTNDVTMQVLDSEEFAEDALIFEIKLPERTSSAAQERSASGLEKANSARDKASNFGQERAAAVKELGRDAQRAVPDNSQRPTVPPGRPDTPGPPENPGPPDNPGNPNKP